MSASDAGKRKHWVKPPTKIYDYNYDYGEGYYKPMVDHLRRKDRGVDEKPPGATTFAERVAVYCPGCHGRHKPGDPHFAPRDVGGDLSPPGRRRRSPPPDAAAGDLLLGAGFRDGGGSPAAADWTEPPGGDFVAEHLRRRREAPSLFSGEDGDERDPFLEAGSRAARTGGAGGFASPLSSHVRKMPGGESRTTTTSDSYLKNSSHHDFQSSVEVRGGRGLYRSTAEDSSSSRLELVKKRTVAYDDAGAWE